MSVQICKREGYYPLCLRALPKENLILKYYIISAWWLHLLDGLGNYVIYPGAVSHIMVMTNNTMNLG